MVHSTDAVDDGARSDDVTVTAHGRAEPPDTVHGRLSEAIHLTGYTFARACSELKWLLAHDRWKQCAGGFEHIDDFLATVDLSEFKFAVDQRKDLARQLKKLRATQRQIGAVLGVDQATVSRDLDAHASKDGADVQPTRASERKTDAQASALPPGIAQSGAAAAQQANRGAAKEHAAADTKARRYASQSAGPRPDGFSLRIGDAREVLADIAPESVHLVLTDPPYGDEAEPLYRWLAEWSARVLVPGGSLICFTGQSRLDRDFDIFGEHLRYWWQLAMRHNHAQRLPGKFVIAEYKPVLWYVKDHRRGRTLVNDVLRSDRRDKDGHDWGQGDGGVELLIQQLTDPDELIVDPFAGTARWGQIAARMGRVWIGSDVVEGGATVTLTETPADADRQLSHTPEDCVA